MESVIVTVCDESVFHTTIFTDGPSCAHKVYFEHFPVDHAALPLFFQCNSTVQAHGKPPVQWTKFVKRSECCFKAICLDLPQQFKHHLYTTHRPFFLFLKQLSRTDVHARQKQTKLLFKQKAFAYGIACMAGFVGCSACEIFRGRQVKFIQVHIRLDSFCSVLHSWS